MAIKLTRSLNKFISFLLVVFFLPMPAFASNSFFEQRYRGWIWFEEPEKVKELPAAELSTEPTQEDYAKAKEEVEQFARELEQLRFMMLRYPNNLEHIRRYKEKEAILLKNALTLSHNYAMVNFLYPELADELEAPANLYGRRIKQQVDRQNQAKEIRQVAGKVELFLFFSSSCPYCELLEKHLASFAGTYGFKVTAVSPDCSKSKYFTTHCRPELVKQLALEVMPTVIAVTNDSSVRFELARGAVSINELEDKAALLANRMQQLEEQYKIEEGKEWLGN